MEIDSPWGDEFESTRKYFEVYPKEVATEERRLQGRGQHTVIRIAGPNQNVAAFRFAGNYVQESPICYRMTLWTEWGPWKLRKEDGRWKIGALREDGCELAVNSSAARPSDITGEWR